MMMMMTRVAGTSKNLVGGWLCHPGGGGGREIAGKGWAGI
jgi:hypothetical protein